MVRWVIVGVVFSIGWLPAAGSAKSVDEAWTEKMQKARAQLAAGDWRAGRKTADKLVAEMAERIAGGEQAARTIGLAITLKAIGEAGTGDLEAAIWHWHVARGLAPDTVNDALLEGFGSAGVALVEHPLREVGSFED